MAIQNEQKVVGASYIISFFKDVQALTHNYAQYLNVMLEVEKKYAKDDMEALGEIEKEIVSKSFQTVRYYSLKCYVSYHAIKGSLKLKDDEEIENNYKIIKNTFIIPRDALEKFVVRLNKLMIEDIIKDLLKTSQDIVGEVYGDIPTPE